MLYFPNHHILPVFVHDQVALKRNLHVLLMRDLQPGTSRSRSACIFHFSKCWIFGNKYLLDAYSTFHKSLRKETRNAKAEASRGLAYPPFLPFEKEVLAEVVFVWVCRL